jgi:Cu/Ag efflux protein CusF
MTAISAVLILSLLAVGGAAETQTPNTVARETTTIATVDRIERPSRVLTVRSEGNAVTTVYVDPSVKAFDDLKVGDVVTVRYTESVVVQVRPNAKLTELQDTTAAARKAGDTDVVQQQKRIVTIEDIDSQGLFVTYRTHDNQRGVHPVQDKALLKGIRRGDRVEITLTQARAVSIERKR